MQARCRAARELGDSVADVMRTRELSIDSTDRLVTDITDAVEEFAAAGDEDGLLNVFAPHATAGLALMETGSGSERDLEGALHRWLPRDDGYVHSHGSSGHGADHLLPVLVAPTLTIPVRGGRMQLGTWQRVVLVDTNRDNPRRTVRLSLLSS